MPQRFLNISSVVIALLLLVTSHGFVPAIHRQPTRLFSSSVSSTDSASSDDTVEERRAVRAPLKFIGPYPCLGLRFPELATPSQIARNLSGIALDFVVDTAANTNTINAQVAQELHLNQTGVALPGVSSGGLLQGDMPTFLLGDAELEGLSDEPFVFMKDLTASALPVTNPGAAGLVSLAFLQVFPGGVEFHWGSKDVPPSITFHDTKPPTDELQKVPIQRVPVTQLPSILITINGVTMPALLDTGSPITVLNARAAQQAGIDTAVQFDSKTSGNNPFAAISKRFQQAQEASNGKVLQAMGTNGPVNLLKSKEAAGIHAATVEFGDATVYVGDLPGLAALQGLGVDSPPAVVLGMDVLSKRPHMLLRAQQDEVWF